MGRGYNSCIYCVGGGASSVCPAPCHTSSAAASSLAARRKVYLLLISKARRCRDKEFARNLFFVFSIHLIVVTRGSLVLDCLLQITHIIPTGSEIIH